MRIQSNELLLKMVVHVVCRLGFILPQQLYLSFHLTHFLKLQVKLYRTNQDTRTGRTREDFPVENPNR